jgi:2-amino-4-hydroxy-6-hydroxymethyldihydropteridine diphosphokinase
MLPESQLAYLSLGSNLGDREGNLKKGISALHQTHLRPRRVSALFETEPVGFRDQPWFLNLVVSVETRCSPEELMARCLEIEILHGRKRSFRNGPRTLDIDLLLYGDLVVNSSRLIIPHPRMAERRFVLEPLAEIAPEVYHPVLKQTIRSLLDSCADRSLVRRYRPGKDS